MNNNIETYQLTIKGKVQYVGFRYWFSNLANSFKIKGYVKNLNDKNQVKAIVQGNIVDILKITEKVKVGPKLALVEEVISEQLFTKVQYTEFVVRY